MTDRDLSWLLTLTTESYFCYCGIFWCHPKLDQHQLLGGLPLTGQCRGGGGVKTHVMQTITFQHLRADDRKQVWPNQYQRLLSLKAQIMAPVVIAAFIRRLLTSATE